MILATLDILEKPVLQDHVVQEDLLEYLVSLAPPAKLEEPAKRAKLAKPATLETPALPVELVQPVEPAQREPLVQPAIQDIRDPLLQLVTPVFWDP